MENIELNTLNDLPKVAREILKYCSTRKIVAFYGAMGVGKTTVIKAICKELQSVDEVTSPTFALVNEYHTQSEQVIFHFDFYRINKIEEVYDLGYEDYFYSGNLCLIEWPEKIEGILPAGYLSVQITEKSDGRRLVAVN